MKTSQENFQLGLLYLVHLLINADGVVNEDETRALLKVKNKENITQSLFDEFQNDVKNRKPKEIYQQGIELINHCDDAMKLRAFAHLYKISEVDGNVHVKEVRLLLYSLKMADIEFNDVVAEAHKLLNY
ncbi:MAG: TerB family tellurite resistance protein [Bacteroidetes bacterium]|nr:TerB family tellurite resistance protein [Bacteroidota bacterium]MBS1540689.1 TerB family tellurite resistance protein [Bacteroidota bacterium]